MLGEPAFVARDHRRDAQREALLAEQRVAAVAGAERPDLTRLGEVHDPLLVGVARPRHVGLAGRERRADRVHARDELAVDAEHVERGLPGARHRAHAQRDVRGVGDLDADVRERRSEGAHAERDDVHGAPAHRAPEQAVERGPHLGRRPPVVGGAGVDLGLGADEGAVLDPGDVVRVGAGPERVGPLLGVEGGEGARLDELLHEELALVVGAVEPVDGVGLAERGDLVDPGEQAGIRGRSRHQGHVEILPYKRVHRVYRGVSRQPEMPKP